jgi:predicted aspartyl protease
MRAHKLFILIFACLCTLTLTESGETNSLNVSKKQPRVSKRMSSGWVKFFVVRGHIFFPVYINKNGKKVFAMLDTGSQKTMIPINMQKRFGISSYGNPRFVGYAGVMNAKFGNPIIMKIGKLNYRIKQPLLVPIDKYMNEIFHLNSDIIIVGSNILKKNIVTIRFKNKLINFSQKQVVKLNHKFIHFVKKKIYKYKGNILINISINKYRNRYKFLIDTGNNGFCTLYPSFWKKKLKSLYQSKRQDSKKYENTNKTVVSQSFSDITKHEKVLLIRKITISQIALGGVPCVISTARFSGEGVAGSLGMGVLNKFNIIIDGPAHEMYIYLPART